MKLLFRKSIGSYKKGMTKNVPEKLARFYVKNGIATKVVKGQTYQTKVLVAEKPEKPEKPEQSEPVVEGKDDYEGLGEDELRALAELRGVKIHHRAGSEKIKEALANADKSV